MPTNEWSGCEDRTDRHGETIRGFFLPFSLPMDDR